ncbi:MAG: DJ-1/PfpI family protein [Deltaproteobacteria bacterium]|nr:DJ-1/PfpI family protein [Deltaproteobacteria bacterium]
MRIGILLFDGAEELDVFGPYEALSAARRLGAGFEVGLGTVVPRERVTLVFGTRLESPDLLEPRAGDWIVVPGGGWLDGAGPGARAEFQKGDLPKKLAEWHGRGVCMASVCTGALLLAAAGISVNRVAATHHGAEADLRATGTLVVTARVVDDGDLVTAGGVSSGIDLGLWLVERLAGSELARGVREYLEYPFPAEIHFGPQAGRSR